ncbi:MAG: GGDEF domain-containing protein [Gammaproteobacteria bacterium]|nr:GGDEF domain-containing protein [Gammaproteobacteria bacterium]
MSNINQDIQASHKILTLLEDANAQSEYILDTVPGVFLIINEKFEILRGNVEFSNIFKIDYEKMLRFDFSTLFEHEVWSIFQKHFSILDNDDSQNSIKFELSISSKSSFGSAKPFFWHLTKMKGGNNAEGKIYSIMGEDISQLRESENKLLNVFASIPLGILTINEKGNVEDTYSSYLSCLLGSDDFNGRSFKEIIFDPIMDDLTRDEIKGIENVYNCLNNTETCFEATVDSFPKQIFFHKKIDSMTPPGDKRKDGKFLKISYKPVAYEGIVKRLLLIIEDRTTIIKAEKDQANASKLEQQSKALYETAIRDPLTGLYTRLYMEESVQDLLDKQDNNALDDISLVMFDIDHFKHVNDTYGHDIGDIVLKEVAAIILEFVSGTDIPIRFGGEEFLVFLPKNGEQGFTLAEQVRKKVEKLVVNINDLALTVTISGGIAERQAGEEVLQLIKRADTQLYQAKEDGRNRNIF